MTEPRTRPRRPNHGPNGSGGTTFPLTDTSDLLYAFGSSPPHLPSTLTVLDEILTDFIIETCHLAALSASYSRRAKLKVEDFKFVLRHDEQLLGRAMEQIWRDKRMKDERKVAGMEEGGGGGVGGLEAAALEGGVGAGEMRGPGRKGKRGKRKRVQVETEEDGGDGVGEGDGRVGKRVPS